MVKKRGLVSLGRIFLLSCGLFLLSACEEEPESKLIDPATVNGMNRFHFKMTEVEQNVLEQYERDLASRPHEAADRKNNYCGRYGEKIIKFPKDYMFMPMTYSDISFFKSNGWKYKMRWCEDPIISFSVVAEWPNLASGRHHFGFEKLDWGTYDQYLIQSQRVNNIDYNNAVIFVYGLINAIDDEMIRGSGKNLQGYLGHLLEQFKSQNASVVKQQFRQDLGLNQIDIRRSKTEVVTVYWRARGNQIDFVAECRPTAQKIYSWCVSHFFPANDAGSVASFMVTEENMRDWRLLMQKAEELFNSFVVGYHKK